MMQTNANIQSHELLFLKVFPTCPARLNEASVMALSSEGRLAFDKEILLSNHLLRLSFSTSLFRGEYTNRFSAGQPNVSCYALIHDVPASAPCIRQCFSLALPHSTFPCPPCPIPPSPGSRKRSRNSGDMTVDCDACVWVRPTFSCLRQFFCTEKLPKQATEKQESSSKRKQGIKVWKK